MVRNQFQFNIGRRNKVDFAIATVISKSRFFFLVSRNIFTTPHAGAFNFHSFIDSITKNPSRLLFRLNLRIVTFAKCVV